MADKFATFSDKLPIECVYLHIDRYKFQAGDTLWWKGYIFTGDQRPALSTNLTVELYSDSGKLICRKLAPIVRSLSAGQISMPDSLKTGRYYLRAYTRYQTNFDSTKYFTAPIAIYNPNDIRPVAVALRKDPDPEPQMTMIDSLSWVSSVNANVLYCLLEADSANKYLNRTLNVVVMSYHQPICRASLKLTKEKLWHDFTLPCNDWDGYVDLLLWADSQLIARQSLFVRQKNTSAVSITADTLNSDPHGYNSWGVHINDSILYNTSISVTDADRTDAAPLDILYALKPDPVNYQDLINNKYPVIKYIDTAYLQWNGRLLKNTSKSVPKPVRNAELISLITAGQDSAIQSDTRVLAVDTGGHFVLNQLFFFDTARMNFQVNHSYSDGSKDLHIIMTDYFSPPRFSIPFKQEWTDSVQIVDRTAFAPRVLPSYPKAKLLDTVTVMTKKTVREQMDKKYTTGVFSEPTLFAFDIRSETTYHTLEEYLRANLPGFECNPPLDTPSWKKRPVIFYLNEELTDWDNLKGYRLNEMAYIKSFMNEHWFGESPFMHWKTGIQSVSIQTAGQLPGEKKPLSPLKSMSIEDPLIICIYLKKGTDWRMGPSDMSSMTLPGFSTIKCFQSAGDNSWTVYWNPLVQTNDFRIRFNNNAITRHFRVCIEGVNGLGKLVHYEKIYAVESDKELSNNDTDAIKKWLDNEHSKSAR